MTCEKINLIEYIEGLDRSGETQNHIQNCARCQKELEAFKTLISLLEEEKKKEFDTLTLEKPLPGYIVKLVKERKEKWKQEQAGKILDKMGCDSQEQKDNIIKLITQDQSNSFLNAAFPDDLVKGKRKNNKDDDKKD